jgi:adenylate cyclase
MTAQDQTDVLHSSPSDSRPLDAEEGQRAHRALLAKLRHDLRTPINAILGYSEILAEQAQDMGDMTMLPDLDKIHAAGAELLALVNDILANDRITAGEFDMDLGAVGEDLQSQLRTPIDAVFGYSELLLEETRERGQTDTIADLEKIRTAAHLFSQVIDDVDSFSGMKTGIIKIDQKTAAAEAMVEEAVKTIRPLKGSEPPIIEPGAILIVDDSPVNRDILAHRLTRQGHRVTVAENGRQALEIAQEGKFDLILLDILMPEMNGFQVLQTLKTDPVRRDIPVIMISALDELDSVVRCIELGAEDYMPKPFNAVLLKARIESSLEKKRLRDRQRELFRKFATKEVVEELLVSGFSLGGKSVEATAMFSDIRSFTTLAEALSPEETIALLNSYFGRVMEAIGSEGGIVNQIVGDGLMAIFGAPLPRPDHRERAVRAGLKMIRRIDLFNQEQVIANKPRIQIGVGIASGQVIAGYTGTEMRATYTCVGDPVNLAARLESHTKVVGRPILIDEATRLGLSGTVLVQDQGTVQLKGKAVPVKIFSVPPAQDV